MDREEPIRLQSMGSQRVGLPPSPTQRPHLELGSCDSACGPVPLFSAPWISFRGEDVGALLPTPGLSKDGES